MKTRKILFYCLFVVLFTLAIWCTRSEAKSPRVYLWAVQPNTINLKAIRPDAKVTAITKDVVCRCFTHNKTQYLAVFMGDLKVAVFDVDGVELRAVVQKPVATPPVAPAVGVPSLEDIQPVQ